jgi:hypothetical protein
MQAAVHLLLPLPLPLTLFLHPMQLDKPSRL